MVDMSPGGMEERSRCYASMNAPSAQSRTLCGRLCLDDPTGSRTARNKNRT